MDLALRAPRATLIACLILFMAAAAGLPNLTLSSDTRVYFADDNPQLWELQAFERKFGQNNTVLIAIQPTKGRIGEPAILSAIGDLTDRAWQLPHSTRVESLVNFPRIKADDGSFSVNELLPSPYRVDKGQARNIESIAVADPLMVNRLISGDGRTAGIIVNFKLAAQGSDDVREIIAAVRAMKEKFHRDYPNISLYATGNVMLMGAFTEAAVSDLNVLIPTGLAVTGLLVFIFLRSLTALIAIISLLCLSSIAAMGVAGWAGYVVNPTTVAAPIVILTVNMAAAIHVVLSAMQALASGQTRTASLAYAIKCNTAPITLTSGTTLVGFLAMNMAVSPPINELGNIVGVGILFSYLFTFTWLPAMVTLLPIHKLHYQTNRIMGSLGRFVTRRSRTLVFLISLACVLISTGLGRIHLDDDFARYFDNRFEFRRASDFVEANLTGLNVMEFDLRSGKNGGIYKPAYQRKVAEFADWLSAQEGVVSVMAIPEITKRIHRAMGTMKTEVQGGIPEDPELIAQYFLLYELSLPFGAEISERINIRRSASRVTVIVKGLTSGGLLNLDGKARSWLQANAPAEMHTSGTSINILFSRLSSANIRSMIGSTLVSIFIIGLIITAALRSWFLGLLSIGTNLIPAVIGFGIWGFLIGDIGLAASTITAMTLGIVVDDTIYFLMKYQTARKRGADVDTAIVEVFSTVGVAMFITTTAVASGFAVLSLSGFNITRSLGAQTTIILVAALLVDWFFLPALLACTKAAGRPPRITVHKVRKAACRHKTIENLP